MLLGPGFLTDAAAVPQPAMACQTADDTTADTLRDQWVVAIQSQHPDHITRLYASDGAMQGFASPVARGSYASIREYYLYYFQFAPQVRLEEHLVETGCNFLIETGNYSWQVRSATGRGARSLAARYRFVYEFADGRWQIGEHIEELTVPEAEEVAFAVPDPQTTRSPIIASPEGPAVAGYLVRTDPAAPGEDLTTHHPLPRAVLAPMALRPTAIVKTAPRSAAPAATLRQQRWQDNVFNNGP